MIGVVSLEERPRLPQGRRQFARERAQLLERGPELVGEAARLPQRGLRLGERARELAQRPAEGILLGRERLEVRVGGVHQPGELPVAVRERRGEQLEVVNHVTDVVAARDQEARELLAVAGGRLEPLQRLAQVLLGGLLEAAAGARGLVVERGAARVEEDLEIRAGVAVQRGQHLVGVHVLQRVRQPDLAALGELARARRARIEGEEHVLQAGLRTEQHVRVAVDRRVLLLDPHHHDGVAVHEVHGPHLADLHAGDVHGLPLTRHHGLGGRQLGLHLVEVGADQRHAGRQVEALVGQDVARDPERRHEQEQERHEHGQLLLDLPLHGPAPIFAAFRSGGVCL